MLQPVNGLVRTASGRYVKVDVATDAGGDNRRDAAAAGEGEKAAQPKRFTEGAHAADQQKGLSPSSVFVAVGSSDGGGTLTPHCRCVVSRQLHPSLSAADQAAVKIQKRARGVLSRKEAEVARKEKVAGAAAARTSPSPKAAKLQQRKEKAAVVRIQPVVRGHLARKRVRAARQGRYQS